MIISRAAFIPRPITQECETLVQIADAFSGIARDSEKGAPGEIPHLAQTLSSLGDAVCSGEWSFREEWILVSREILRAGRCLGRAAGDIETWGAPPPSRALGLEGRLREIVLELMEAAGAMGSAPAQKRLVALKSKTAGFQAAYRRARAALLEADSTPGAMKALETCRILSDAADALASAGETMSWIAAQSGGCHGH